MNPSDSSDNSNGTVAFVGCGYVGERFARRHVGSNTRLAATTRWSERATALRAFGVTTHVTDYSEVDYLAKALGRVMVIVHSIPPDATGDETRMVCDLALATQAKGIVYLGTTGVYPEVSSAWMDEDTRLVDGDTRAKLRVRAEDTLRAFTRKHGVSVVVLRLGAIYGPGRGLHMKREVPPPIDLSKIVSRVHCDDVVTSIEKSIERLANNPQRKFGVFNVVDDEPSPSADVIQFVAKLRNASPPKWFKDSSDFSNGRRIVNTRLKKELGVSLAHPSYRSGMAAVLAEESRG